eukprot:11513-Heterococcus_DN1.PRE.1
MRLALQSSAAALSVMQHATRPTPHAPGTASSLRAVAVPDAAINTDKISKLHQLTGQNKWTI